MDQTCTERADAAAGVAFVVLILVAAFIAGQPPVVTDSTDEVREFVLDKRDSIQAAAFFSGLAGIAFLWFIGTLRAELRAIEGGTGRLTEIAFGSGIALLALFLVGAALMAATTLHTEQLVDSTLRALYDAQAYVYVMIAFPAAGLTAGSAAILLRTGALSRAAGALGAFTAAVSVISGLSLYGETDSFFSIGGGIGFVAFLLFVLWALVTSIALMRGVELPAAGRGPARDAPG